MLSDGNLLGIAQAILYAVCYCGPCVVLGIAGLGIVFVVYKVYKHLNEPRITMATSPSTRSTKEEDYFGDGPPSRQELAQMDKEARIEWERREYYEKLEEEKNRRDEREEEQRAIDDWEDRQRERREEEERFWAEVERERKEEEARRWEEDDY